MVIVKNKPACKPQKAAAKKEPVTFKIKQTFVYTLDSDAFWGGSSDEFTGSTPEELVEYVEGVICDLPFGNKTWKAYLAEMDCPPYDDSELLEESTVEIEVYKKPATRSKK